MSHVAILLPFLLRDFTRISNDPYTISNVSHRPANG